MGAHEPRAMTGAIGIVVIGRNEGSRLDACLSSVAGDLEDGGYPVVYVDSASGDDSVAIARAHGATIVELDGDTPFTAARARNAGFARLRVIVPDLALVQFVDGDCTLAADWIGVAAGYLSSHPSVGIVCGRRRERHPETSRYNRLCDHEWDTPVGLATTCGGDALMRTAALDAAGGFSPDLIAGEEPDLCRRVRAAGWTIHRIDEEMTTHDAAMTRFAQWWQRNRRSGFAYAEALDMHGTTEPGTLRPVISNVWWTLPLSWPLWPLLWWRMWLRRDALYATSILIGKLPQLHGQIDFWTRRHGLIEYK